MTPRTADGVRRRPGRTTGRAVLVLTTERTPEWVERWCRSTGRVAGTAIVPATEPVASVVPELAAHAAREGSAVLLVHDVPPVVRPDRTVVVAIRRLPEDLAVVDEAALCAAAVGARLQVVHAVPTSFGEKSVGLEGALDRGRAVLALARRRARRAVPGLTVDVRLLRVRAHEVVGERLDADLVVLGGPRPETDGALGLVALSALHHAPCPVLLVPRGTGWNRPAT